MADTKTSKDFTVGSSNDTTWPYTFNSYQKTDIAVQITDAAGAFVDVTNFTVENWSTASGTVTFVASGYTASVQTNDGAPINGRTIRIYRNTNVHTGTVGAHSPKADFTAGSTIRADDLDNNQKQALYAIYELQDQEIISKRIRDGAITSAKILDGTIVNADINTSAEIAVSKLADGSARQVLQTAANGSDVEWTSNVDVPGTLDVTGAATFDNSVTAGTFTGNLTGNVTGNCTGSSGSTTGNASTATTATNFTASANNSTNETVYPVFVDGATGAQGAETDTGFTYNPSTGNITATKFTGAVTGDVTGNADTATDLAAAAKITSSEHSGHTANDTTYYTTSASDARYYNIGTSEEIQSGEAWTSDDAKVATTKAIDNRVVDLIDDVGGFVALTNEAAIPQYHPEKANETTADRVGTIISIGVLSATYTPSGGTCTIPSGTLTNHAVNATITDCGSTTLSSGFGVLVETTAQTDAQYAAGPAFKFHRLTPKATEVTTVAGKATEITTCHTNITNINTVAGNNTNINTVAGSNSNITAVAGKITDVETVSDNLTDVSNFADLYQIATSAPGTDGGGNSLAAGDLWFDSSSNKQLKVHTGTAFAAVSPTQAVLDDIAIVSGDLTRQEDLGSIADALASPTTTSDLATVADNITDINTFKNVYRIADNAPSSSLDAGDLWYDGTANVLKYYTGSAWTVTAGAGLSTVADDTSPELGGNLDCNNKNLTEVATVSGDNLQIDFGTIA